MNLQRNSKLWETIQKFADSWVLVINSNILTVSGLPVPCFGQLVSATAGMFGRASYSLMQRIRFHKRRTTIHKLHSWLHQYSWLYILFPFWPHQTSQLPWTPGTRFFWCSWWTTKPPPPKWSSTNWCWIQSYRGIESLLW